MERSAAFAPSRGDPLRHGEPRSTQVTIGLDKLHISEDTDEAGRAELRPRRLHDGLPALGLHDSAGAFSYGDGKDIDAGTCRRR